MNSHVILDVDEGGPELDMDEGCVEPKARLVTPIKDAFCIPAIYLVSIYSISSYSYKSLITTFD